MYFYLFYSRIKKALGIYHINKKIKISGCNITLYFQEAEGKDQKFRKFRKFPTQPILLDEDSKLGRGGYGTVHR
jgi:hypothetical protein